MQGGKAARGRLCKVKVNVLGFEPVYFGPFHPAAKASQNA
jgi:hypothetical protein